MTPPTHSPTIADVDYDKLLRELVEDNKTLKKLRAKRVALDHAIRAVARKVRDERRRGRPAPLKPRLKLSNRDAIQ